MINSKLTIVKTNNKIGEIVRSTFPEIVKDKLITEAEVERLQSYSYSKSKFDLNYPVLKRVDESISIKENRMVKDHTRYYANPIKINDKRYLLTSEWYERNKNYYIHWLNNLTNK